MKTYKFNVPEEHEIQMIQVIKNNKYNGLFWPNNPNDQYNFELDLSEEDAIAILIQIPCKLVP